MLYPGSINKEYKRNIPHKNRGMKLENLINLKSSGVACKIKIPSMNKEYIINDVQVQYDNDSLELSNIRTSKKRTVLNLNEIRR